MKNGSALVCYIQVVHSYNMDTSAASLSSIAAAASTVASSTIRSSAARAERDATSRASSWAATPDRSRAIASSVAGESDALPRVTDCADVAGSGGAYLKHSIKAHLSKVLQGEQISGSGRGADLGHTRPAATADAAADTWHFFRSSVIGARSECNVARWSSIITSVRLCAEIYAEVLV